MEPLDENGERDDEEGMQLSDPEEEQKPDAAKAKSGATELDDEEEPSDPTLQKKHDDENMACATEKILRKMQQVKDKGGDARGMMIDNTLITPELFNQVDKRT